MALSRQELLFPMKDISPSLYDMYMSAMDKMREAKILTMGSCEVRSDSPREYSFFLMALAKGIIDEMNRISKNNTPNIKNVKAEIQQGNEMNRPLSEGSSPHKDN